MTTVPMIALNARDVELSSTLAELRAFVHRLGKFSDESRVVITTLGDLSQRSFGLEVTGEFDADAEPEIEVDALPLHAVVSLDNVGRVIDRMHVSNDAL